jgi:hypothetical protein
VPFLFSALPNSISGKNQSKIILSLLIKNAILDHHSGALTINSFNGGNLQ